MVYGSSSLQNPFTFSTGAFLSLRVLSPLDGDELQSYLLGRPLREGRLGLRELLGQCRVDHVLVHHQVVWTSLLQGPHTDTGEVNNNYQTPWYSGRLCRCELTLSVTHPLSHGRGSISRPPPISDGRPGRHFIRVGEPLYDRGVLAPSFSVS